MDKIRGFFYCIVDIMCKSHSEHFNTKYSEHINIITDNLLSRGNVHLNTHCNTRPSADRVLV
jgi:hypothetical protein